MKKIFYISIITLLFLSVTTIASAQWTTTHLMPGMYPQINAGGQMVATGIPGTTGDTEIFYYDGSTATQLTSNSGSDSEPQLNNSGHAVWAGHDDLDYEIFYYNGNVTTQLTNNSQDDSNPQINNSGHIVWYRNDSSTNKILYYDGNTVTQLPGSGYNPQINDNGHVVWEGWDGSDYEIFYYNGNVATQLTNNSQDDSNPQINDNGHVVWEGWDDSDLEIFYYDSNTTTQLTNNSGPDSHPQINASGHVVWSSVDDYYDYEGEIFYYDGNAVTRLTNTPKTDYYPQINDSGHVVWRGSYGSDGSSDDEIYYYDGNYITQLTNNTDTDSSPQINNSNQVVWYGKLNNVNNWQTFIAEFIGSDTDNDEVIDGVDNCPNIANPDQKDVDNDGTGDICDTNTIFGTFSGDVQAGVNVCIYKLTCGGDLLIDTAIADENGYYAFDRLDDAFYNVVPEDSNYSYNPEHVSVQIPQTAIQPYDFTATGISLSTIESISANMVTLPEGTFLMGCTSGDTNCRSEMSPQHEVTISSFKISKYEVTQSQWEAVMGSVPSSSRNGQGDNYPVYFVSWDEVQAFITELHTQTGLTYHLPTEAEWEYATKAGTTTTWSCGDDENCLDDIAWYYNNSGGTSHPVGQKKPNAWGLYDMSGNVNEWVQNWYSSSYYSVSPSTDPTGPVSGSYRGLRGGSRADFASWCRPAYRDRFSPSDGLGHLGFRLCR